MRTRHLLCTLLVFLEAPTLFASEPTPTNLAAFTSYASTVEQRLAQQHRFPATFLTSTSKQLTVEHLTVPSTPGALLHHWRATAFAPGATAADFTDLIRDFDYYPQHFAPQVELARTLSQTPAHTQAWLRIRQHHVITVVMDTTYDVTFGQLDTQHGYTISRSTRIEELDSPGTLTQHTLTPADQHGFLYRLNTYWSYEERDGGLYLQVESISLTRSIPTGLSWLIGPYLESIPRESLEFTLTSAINALRK